MIEMTQELLDEIAFLFVEQYDNLYGMTEDRENVRRIRRSADCGETALYAAVSSVFEDRLDEAFVGAAHGAMDYIAYVDESGMPENEEARQKTMETMQLHLDSLKEILKMAGQNERKVFREIMDFLEKAETIFQRLKG